MAELKTKCGAVFFVDEDIVEKIRKFNWRLDKDGYVMRKTAAKGNRAKEVRLHRMVAGCSDPLILIDHINCNRLDNTRENLRQATRSQNSQNTLKARNCSSVFRGVTKHKKTGRWQSSIKVKGKFIYLGLYEDEHEAGHAYNVAAIENFGEFARLNPVGHKFEGVNE